MNNDPRKAAIVTGGSGGSGGIGAAIALRLACDGFAVMIQYAGNAGKARAVVQDIEAHNGRAIAVQGNIGNPEDADRLFATTHEALGHINVVVTPLGKENFCV